jgi:DNA-binding transcriptional MerR regulator
MTVTVEIPNKVFFKIGEVSRIIDVPEHTIRYWEEEFSQVRPQKTKSGQRLYRRRDIELLAQIKQLLWEQKFKIAGARLRLRRDTESQGKAAEQRKVDASREKELSNELVEVKHRARLIRDEANAMLDRIDGKHCRGVAQPG